MKKAVKGKGYEKAVIIYSSTLLKSFAKIYKLREAKALESIVNPLGIYEFGKGKLLVHMDIGAPMTAVAAEELIAAGVNEFFIIGTAGELNPNMEIEDFVRAPRLCAMREYRITTWQTPGMFGLTRGSPQGLAG